MNQLKITMKKHITRKVIVAIGAVALVIYGYHSFTQYQAEQDVRSKLDGVSPLSCLPTPREASSRFGTTIATANDTIVVGDPQGNTVWIFTESNNSSWDTSKLTPPPDSEFAKRGKGFGHSVDIDDSGAIVIGAQIREAMGVAPRKEPGSGMIRFSGIYVAESADEPVSEVTGLDALQEEYIYGHSVARSGEQIGIGLRVISGDEYGVSRVLTVDLADGTQQLIEAPETNGSGHFGYNLAAHDTYLLASFPSSASSTGVIVDVVSGDETIISNNGTSSRPKGFEVDISEQYAVTGGAGGFVVARKEAGNWQQTYVSDDANEAVATVGTRVGTLSREGSRIIPAGDTEFDIPALDLTLMNLETNERVTNRMAPLEDKKIRTYPMRSLDMTDDFAVIGQPFQSKCHVAVTYFTD